MKVSQVRLSWFRGAANLAELSTNDRSLAVYGPNGAGKSCFVDAIEYTLRSGRIEHLAHEYSGKNQEKAVLNTHRPEGVEAGIEIVLADKSRIEVSISPNGTHATKADGGDDFLALDCARTVLRQDEVSQFIHSTKGEKYSVLLPLLGLGHLETAAENFRQLSKSVLKVSGSRDLATALRSAEAQYKKALGEASEASADDTIESLCTDFVTEAHEHGPDTCSELADAAITALLKDSSALERQQVALESLGNTGLRGGISAVRSAAANLAAMADQVVQRQLEILRSTSSFLKESREGESVPCPACGTDVPRADIVAHVEFELDRLEDAESKAIQYRQEVRDLAALAKQVVSACKSDEIATWVAAASDKRVKPIVEKAAEVEVPGEGLSDADLKSFEDSLIPAVMAAAAAASFLPPAATELAQAKERLSAAANLRSAEKEAARGRAAEELADRITAVEADIREQIRDRSKAIIAEISSDIQRMWTILHPGEPIEDVRLHVPGESEKAIDIALKFYGKDLASPRLTLSEGYRNSLGLCVFLAMAGRYGDGVTPVVLDDVIVSLDRGHRGMVVDLLEAEFSDRQVILFTHDRDWFVDLRQQLAWSDWAFRSLLPYSNPEEGIRWSDRTGTMDDARAYLKSRPDTAANEARKAMDVELARHCERLGIRLPFARGARNDRRTAYEFLQELISEGKKRFQTSESGAYEAHEEAISAFEAADKLLVTWANRGSHTEDVTKSEAERLIDTCADALDALACSSCERPVSFAETTAGRKQCKCGTLRWK